MRMRKGEMHTGTLSEKTVGKRQFGRPRHRRNINTKMDIQEIRWGGGVDLIYLTQNRDIWPVSFDTVRNFWVP